MKLAIEIPDSQAKRLKKQADALGVKTEELAKAAVQDLLAAHDEDFLTCAKRVLQKNKELYERLS